jgi:ribose transport system permease protein
MKVFVLSGLLSGLAGFLALAEYSGTTISGHTTDLLQALTAVVLGGASIYGGSGSMIGTGIGVLIPAVLLDGLVVANLQPFWQQVAVGIVLVSAVYVDGVRRRADTTAVGQQ